MITRLHRRRSRCASPAMSLLIFGLAINYASPANASSCVAMPIADETGNIRLLELLIPEDSVKRFRKHGFEQVACSKSEAAAHRTSRSICLLAESHDGIKVNEIKRRFGMPLKQVCSLTRRALSER